MKLSKRTISCFVFLLLISGVFIFNALSNTENIAVYVITLFMISISIIRTQTSTLLNANNFFMLYYIYVLALGPIFFLREGIILSYNYYTYILGGLLCFAWGGFITNALPINRRIREFKIPISIKMERVQILRILWGISIVAGLVYAYKNKHLLFSGDIQNGRVSAMAGNGVLIQLSQMSTVTIPMMYEVYHDGIKVYNKKISTIYEIVVMSIISFFILLMQGYRSYAMTGLLCLVVVMIGKRNISGRKMLVWGVAGVTLLEGLGLIRSKMSSSTYGAIAFMKSMRDSMVVNSSNLGHVINTFPDRTPFQYGKTYLMNFAILKPGPDIDFTLWLKEQVGVSFAGGGRTATILGEAYINFGVSFIFIFMFLFGVLGVFVSNYNDSHYKNFMGAYLMWQFAHAASGGVGNVLLPVIINFVIYTFVMSFPIRISQDVVMRGRFRKV